jgi:hypothetical protein
MGLQKMNVGNSIHKFGTKIRQPVADAQSE